MLKIDGFGISPYRSFGGEPQHLGPLSKVNLVIGQNNSGKSNILRFAAHHLHGMVDAAFREISYEKFSQLDSHIGPRQGTLTFVYGLDLNGSAFTKWFADLQPRSSRELLVAIETLLESPVLVPGNALAWFKYESTDNAGLRISQSLVKSLADSNILAQREWANIWTSLTHKTGGSLLEHWIPESLHALSLLGRAFPQVALVPAIREVLAAQGKESDFSGRGLIDRLAKLQNPGYRDQAMKDKFRAVNLFLQEVTGSDSAAIEIPAERDTILTHLDGRTLPLESLGTGIHEVVILAAAATSVSDHLVCMEEPEIHLHPILQRKLLAYLQKNTDNQYLIATHSGHLLDVPSVSVFHVRLSNGLSLIRPAISAAERFNICADLGYRASDLLQANCVIWVEGPSDRIYLRHWLRHMVPDLVEGTHYSIMFYGGRLLSHLTANDPEIDEFISLRRLNRFVGILIDSDRSHGRSPLNSTKRRVRDEISKGSGLAWITAGRAIENYVPASILEAAIREVHSDVVRVPEPGQFDKTLVYYGARAKQKEADKVKVASRVVQQPALFDVLDLRRRMRELVAFVEGANDVAAR